MEKEDLTHTHNHSEALQLFRQVGPPQIKPILLYPSFQSTNFTLYRSVKLKNISQFI